MASKKERNHYNLKEIQNYCTTKTFPKRLTKEEKKQILDKPQSDFLLKMDNYITKRADLSLQIRIVKSTQFMISTKVQAILVTQKQCQVILGESQLTKKVLHVSFGMGFTTMLRTA